MQAYLKLYLNRSYIFYTKQHCCVKLDDSYFVHNRFSDRSNERVLLTAFILLDHYYIMQQESKSICTPWI